MNSDDQHDLVRLAAAANPFQAHIWEQALQKEGIRCQVLGDYLNAGIGDIPGMAAEVWVEAADFVRAEAILRQHRDRSEEAAQPAEEGRDWAVGLRPDDEGPVVGQEAGGQDADGMPLVWIMRRRGFAHQPRLSGPDFMWRFCARAQELGLGIYLYGGTSEALALLCDRMVVAFPKSISTFPPEKPLHWSALRAAANPPS